MVRRIVIVGAGLAGSRCAQTLRAEGFDGAIALLGEEQGLPYERPALSKDFLAGSRAELALQPASFWSDREILLLAGMESSGSTRSRSSHGHARATSASMPW